ncbi:hypothetical protein [Nonomuraea sp. NPDC050691]|uniref:hypothetical protein n=1 Tax=Nonomuraea sp. NPDC050691 TaxID=3155661 RepID=UPI0033CBFE57
MRSAERSIAAPTNVPPSGSTTENGACPCSLSSTANCASFEPGVIGRHGRPTAREWVTTSS